MKVTYHEKHDLLYISFDEGPQQVSNRRVDEDVVLDLAEGDRIVGIEILDASGVSTFSGGCGGNEPRM
jgi:uncharacterized protein YuzE